MTEAEAMTRVRQELREHLADGLREIGAYSDTYVRSVLTNPRAVNVRPPKRLHPKLAAMARDLALDVLTAETVTVEP